MLFLIVGVYGLVALILLLIAKIRKKAPLFTKTRGCIYAASLLSLVNVILLLVNGVALRLGPTTVIVHGVLVILFAAAILVSLAMILLRMRERQLIIPSLMGLTVLLNVIYWQMWMFWV